MKRIIIADDHAVVRYGLKIMLTQALPEIRIDEAWDSASVKSELKQGNCELILLDLIMPDTDPNSLIHWIKNFYPKTKILIVSMNDETLFGKRILQLGADGYIKKDSTADEIVNATMVVLSGEKYISSSLKNLIVQQTISGNSDNPFDSLTPREFQVASYMLRDYSISQISDALNIQYTTASTFKQRVFEKLNVLNRKEFLDLAAVYGFKSA